MLTTPNRDYKSEQFFFPRFSEHTTETAKRLTPLFSFSIIRYQCMSSSHQCLIYADMVKVVSVTVDSCMEPRGISCRTDVGNATRQLFVHLISQSKLTDDFPRWLNSSVLAYSQLAVTDQFTFFSLNQSSWFDLLLSIGQWQFVFFPIFFPLSSW